jgi:hypothetical protein
LAKAKFSFRRPENLFDIRQLGFRLRQRLGESQVFFTGQACYGAYWRIRQLLPEILEKGAAYYSLLYQKGRALPASKIKISLLLMQEARVCGEKPLYWHPWL